MDNNDNKPVVLFFCEHTARERTRSGIQRVVVEAAHALRDRVDLRFVKWDAVDGQLRYLDQRDLDGLLGSQSRALVRPHPACHRVAYRFGDTLEDVGRTWLLFPEIPYFVPQGNARFASIVAQCREYGVRTAAVFYDLIPAREAAYAAGRADHLAYLAEVVRCDRVFTISRFAADDLLDFLREQADLSPAQLTALADRVVPVPLGEHREGEAWGLPLDGDAQREQPLLVMVGTVEPRKQQVRLLKALNDARMRCPELSRLRVEVFGSLHPASAEALHAEIARNPQIAYRQYASDAVIEDAYARAWFSAFVSNHEGYGLPIVESVRRGVPCLTASFGAMAEVAEGGGCLQVDVNDDLALQDALIRMMRGAGLRERLVAQIAQRPRRSWGDYADDLLGSMASLDSARRADEERFQTTAQETLRRGQTAQASLHGIHWTLAASAAGLHPYSTDRANGRAAALYAPQQAEASRWQAGQALSVIRCDVIACGSALRPAELVQAARDNAIGELLPADITDGPSALEEALQACVRISRQRAAALQMAADNRVRSDLLTRFAALLPQPARELAIVISTYNRAGFVELNVAWILEQIERDQLPVQCVVVDNASTDDSFARLQRFVGRPHFTLVQNANNVGMLGNLRVCAAGHFAPHVWLTGDDDYIVPGAIQRTLQALRRQPGLPLLIHNFGVYHRAQLSPQDHPEQFLREIIRLAPQPQPEGVRRINDIAAEHDNLFTAIYPIVFRSDVLAACFNHTFDGIPFGNLTESVPTTQMILGTYRYCDAYWFAEPGIVGNAHNSWSSHRPRWHLVLMPLVLQLARDAGVEPGKVWEWIRVHKALFDEAVGISIAQDVPAHIVVPDDVTLATRNFREPVTLDPRLRVQSAPPVPLWRPVAQAGAT